MPALIRPIRMGIDLMGHDWSKRSEEPEAMDDPACPRERLRRTFRQFRVSNVLFARYRHILRATVLADLARDPATPRTLVDLGAGGTDIAAWLCREAEKLGARLEVVAIDNCMTAVDYARTVTRGTPGLSCVAGDALDVAALPRFDYVFSNHFLHHLRDRELVTFLQQISSRNPRLVVFSDVERNRFTYLAITAVCTLFFRRSYALVDGRSSVRKAFRRGELHSIVDAAGLEGKAFVSHMPPGRLVLTMGTGGAVPGWGQARDLPG